MSKRSIIVMFITLFAWVLSNYFMPTFQTDYPLLNMLLRIAFPLATLSMGLVIIHRRTSIASVWGLTGNFRSAFYIAFICCLPMMIGYGIMAGMNIQITWKALAWTILLAPLFEELVYRGFLFGQLFRFGGWGFIPAGMINALIFGSLHLYQASSLSSAIGIFSVTAMGGMWFAWLYIEWDRNLWVPIFMHLLMNAWWSFFAVDVTAGGGWAANIFRAMTIALSVIITIRRNQKNGGPRITRRNLWTAQPEHADDPHVELSSSSFSTHPSSQA